MCADWVREEDPPNYTSDQLSIAHVKDGQVAVAVSSLARVTIIKMWNGCVVLMIGTPGPGSDETIRFVKVDC